MNRNRLFEKRREEMLTYQAMREGKLQTSHQLSCPNCGRESTMVRWHQNRMVCPLCGHHLALGAYTRLWQILDAGSFEELDPDLAPGDPISFPDYPEKLEGLRDSTGLLDSAVAAVGAIAGHRAVLVVLDSQFMMGSMGTAVGEKVTRAVELAARRRRPLIIFSACGGARMQEGILALLQMAKTASAIARFQKQGGLYISCLTHPTTGGVTASFASLGDIMLAEPGALIGFAGPRVIEQTIGEKLPEGFQRAEFLLDNGFLDQIVPRHQWREVLARLLMLHEGGGAG